MQISKNGIELIKSYEGLSLKACKCVASEKYYTIGYGHYGVDVKANDKITKAKALELLQNDITRIEILAKNKVPFISTLNQNQYDALISFSYNCGVGNLAKLCKDNNLTNISNRFTLYCKSSGKFLQGLYNRRVKERKLFNTPIDSYAKVVIDIINGKYGNGAERKKKLAEKGFSESEIKKIQKMVNEEMKNNDIRLF